MILREGDAGILYDERSFLDFVLLGDFPWFYVKATDNFFLVTHMLMLRPEEFQSPEDGIYLPKRGEINSSHYRAAEELFLRICGDNNISVRTIYRMAFNTTFADPSKHGDLHVDHDFPHKNFLLYLNGFDDGNTLLFDESGKHVQTIYAAKDKFAFFDGNLHAQQFCKPQQRRVVFVVTFDGDVNGG